MPALQLTSEFFPGMGPAGQHVVGATNLGVTIVDVTLGCNTNMTDAQLIAAPTNTSVAVATAFGPVVHSLGVAPSFALAQALSNSIGPVNYVYITADNSAVYFKAYTATAGATGVPAGVRTRVIAVR